MILCIEHRYSLIVHWRKFELIGRSTRPVKQGQIFGTNEPPGSAMVQQSLPVFFSLSRLSDNCRIVCSQFIKEEHIALRKNNEHVVESWFDVVRCGSMWFDVVTAG